MAYADLFDWWALVITAGIIFLIIISTYLYVSSKKKRLKKGGFSAEIYRAGINFIFVWVLLSLLILYVVSIGNISAILFALGNIIVEAALLIYLLKNSINEA